MALFPLILVWKEPCTLMRLKAEKCRRLVNKASIIFRVVFTALGTERNVDNVGFENYQNIQPLLHKYSGMVWGKPGDLNFPYLLLLSFKNLIRSVSRCVKINISTSHLILFSSRLRLRQNWPQTADRLSKLRNLPLPEFLGG